ncbi:MAG: helix-turn-helix transcriptional regulator [Oscillospiraceae bacterium]|nr:helix-turn-helix transcriptional regulator [Oscillospiraceae bacterium]MDE6004699.1 helix-turn-helix transcriptional regulator [Oscillospiraceae bacterium]
MKNSQEIAITIKQIAKSRKIAIGRMLTDCGLSVNTLSSMQSGGFFPRLEAITKIADYLDCSVDYLLGRTDVPNVNFQKKTAEDSLKQEFFNAFDSLSLTDKVEVMSIVLEKLKS